MNSGQVLPPKWVAKKPCAFWSCLNLGLLNKAYIDMLWFQKGKKLKKNRRVEGYWWYRDEWWWDLKEDGNTDFKLKVTKKQPYNCRREGQAWRHRGGNELGLWGEHWEGLCDWRGEGRQNVTGDWLGHVVRQGAWARPSWSLASHVFIFSVMGGQWKAFSWHQCAVTYIFKNSFWLQSINKVVWESRRDILRSYCGDPRKRIWGLDSS